ncbi:LysR family transcriptional regulator [Ensifer adhaerens]|uniref:LysR family transcriptional regulator n=1 Tax=Ensifer adhaerens TaxID=106592 RepID=UPI00098F8E4A|nr:LysR family transcriptional regulator [Ensifer adhaerens]
MQRTRLDIRDWEAFVTLVQLGHFGNTADALGITQSAVSQRLSKLESDLQLKLMMRTSRGAEPTPEGARLLLPARALIAAKRAALEAAEAIRKNGARPIRLVLSNAVAHTTLLPRLKVALEAALEVDFFVDVLAANDVEATLLSGENDLAVTTLPISRPGVEEKLVATLPMGIALPAETALQSIKIEELCRHPLLLLPRETEPELFDALISIATQAGHTLQIKHSVVSFPSILAMVQMGMGWGLIPLAMAEATPKGVKVLPFELAASPSIRVRFAWRAEDHRVRDLARLVGADIALADQSS